jgi:hypothetical protein
MGKLIITVWLVGDGPFVVWKSLSMAVFESVEIPNFFAGRFCSHSRMEKARR